MKSKKKNTWISILSTINLNLNLLFIYFLLNIFCYYTEGTKRFPTERFDHCNQNIKMDEFLYFGCAKFINHIRYQIWSYSTLSVRKLLFPLHYEKRFLKEIVVCCLFKHFPLSETLVCSGYLIFFNLFSRLVN